MNNYLQLAQKILLNGNIKGDRTGTGTRSLFGEQLRFDLQKGFPLLTTKKVHLKSIIVELLWMLSGSTNVKDLQAQGVRIWDEWADQDGSLGPVYGTQWRYWNANVRCDVERITDQIRALVDGLKNDPNGRRHIVTAWNPSDLQDQKLPCCHCFFQCYVAPGELEYTKSEPLFGGARGCSIASGQGPGKLSLVLHQRSADFFLGVPFNMASYALLTHMLAQVCGYDVGELIINYGDVHIYNNHVDQIREQLSRDPRPLPTLELNKAVDDIDAFKYTDIHLEGYNPHPVIKAPVSV